MANFHIIRAGIVFIYLMSAGILFAGLFFAAPDKWILDYRSIHVQDACVGDLELSASSVRYPKITTTGRGEDNVYIYKDTFDSYKDAGLPVDRIPWNDATYRVGTTEDAWPIELHHELPTGQYVLVGEPILKWIILERTIDPIQSEPFNIKVCE